MKTPEFEKRWSRDAEKWELATSGQFPKDLTEWVGSFTLVREILNAQAGLEAASLPAKFNTRTGTYRPQMLATLLSWAYAKGLMGSRDIELALPTTPALKYICAGDRPDWNVLRRFRRQYQGLIQGCLTEVLRRTWENQYPGTGLETAGLAYADLSLNRWADSGRPDFAAEAARRIRLAIQADTLLSDE